jgi:curved DNA-binding protein CbpA
VVNAYEILEMNESSSTSDIRLAYKKKAKLYHPDQGGNVDDFLNLRRALEILEDENKRALLGSEKLFRKPLLRIWPSMSGGAQQLFENLETLATQLKQLKGGGK